jgi:hypothetical protein
MSQNDQYSEAGPSSHIAPSQTESYANPDYPFDLSDPPVTPHQSISQQPPSSTATSGYRATNSIPIPPSLEKIVPPTHKHYVLWTEMKKTDFIQWWLQTAGANPYLLVGLVGSSNRRARKR